MNKNILLFATALLLAISVRAQQIPLYTQMYFMRMLYNPALVGYNGETNIYGFYRTQWTDMPGHPITGGATGEISLWKDQIGTGFHVISDNTDIIHRINAQAYYSQKIHIAKDHILSLGFSLGVMDAHVDFANAKTADADDQHMLTAGKSATAFDMSVGLAYQWKKLTIGFAVPQVINTRAKLMNQLKVADYGNKRQFLGTVSYEISLKEEKFNIEPCVLVKSGSSLPVQVDVDIMANYKRIAYLGVGYRLDYGMAFMAAVRISQAVTVGYSYDFPIMKGVKYADVKGAHELVVGINFTKWMKKSKENEKKLEKLDKVDSLAAKNDDIKKQLDSLTATVDTAKQNIDSLKQNVESLKKQTEEQSVREKQLRENIDSLQTMMKDSFERLTKEYQKKIKDKPAKNFPSKVDKSTKAGKGDIYRLNNVEFDRNSSYLKASSYPELDKLIKFMEVNPDAHIRVMGHTCDIASDEYNQWLSERRAKRVQDYMVEKGIAEDRITFIGFGKKAPIADNSTEEGRALNRRVEIEIVK